MFDFMRNLALHNFADMPKFMYFSSLRNIYVFSIRDDVEGNNLIACMMKETEGKEQTMLFRCCFIRTA